MTTSTISAEAEAYLAAVRSELDDLPEEERGDLLDDLSSHLAELSTHDADDGAPLQVRLGLPSEYAAELRAAAGLPPRAAGGSPDRVRRRMGQILAASAAGRLATQLRHHPWTVQVVILLRELRPAWWVLRGYLIIAVPALWAPDRHDDFPLPTVLGNRAVGAALVVAAVVASVSLGRRGPSTRARPLVRVLDVALAMGALLLLGDAGARTVAVHHFDASTELGYALVSPYGPVTNIYPYSLDGSPLEDVLLFDQDGRPLRVEPQQWWPDGCDRQPRHPQATDGEFVPWVYPQTYVVQDRGIQGGCSSVRRPAVPLPTFEEQALEEQSPAPPAGWPDND